MARATSIWVGQLMVAVVVLCFSTRTLAQQSSDEVADTAKQRVEKGSSAEEDGASEEPKESSLGDTLTGLARAEYEAGRILYTDGDFKTASLKFERAYEESKNPRLLWDVAAAEKNLRHYVRVEELVDRYLREGGTSLTSAERADARVLLDTVRKFISKVTINTDPAGATVKVDGKEAGTTPLEKPVPVELGTHTIEVTRKGYQPYRQTLQITGSSQIMELQLKPDVHEGTLLVQANTGDVIQVDDEVKGKGKWQGILPSGRHVVEVSADGYTPYRGDSVVEDDRTTTLQVSLRKELEPPPPMTVRDSSSGNSSWAWVSGGVLIAAGLAVGGYFLLNPGSSGPPPPVEGTIDTVELPLRF